MERWRATRVRTCRSGEARFVLRPVRVGPVPAGNQLSCGSERGATRLRTGPGHEAWFERRAPSRHPRAGGDPGSCGWKQRARRLRTLTGPEACITRARVVPAQAGSQGFARLGAREDVRFDSFGGSCRRQCR